MALSDAVLVARSGLEMQRVRMELISSNLANSQTTRTSEGGPYRRRLPIIEAAPPEGSSFADHLDRRVQGVQVRQIDLDQRDPIMRFEPGHPDANAKGYVAYPNVNPVEEMVDMISAVRSYEANVNVVKAVGQMHRSALQISRG